MKLRIRKETAIDFVWFIYMFSAMAFASMPTYRYIYYFFALVVAILFGLECLADKRFFTRSFFVRMLTFVIICYVSAFLGENVSNSIRITNSIVVNMVFCSLSLNYGVKYNKTHTMITILCVSGIAMSVYLVFSEGFASLVSSLLSYSKIGGTIGNENTIGTFAALSSIIAVYFVKQYKQYIYLIGVPLTVFITLGSGSRISILLLGVGVFFVFLKGTDIRTILKTIVSIAVVLTIFLYILSRPEFAVLSTKVSALTDLVFQGETKDRSMNFRMTMIQLGVDRFLENPFVGMGIGNSRLLLIGVLSNTYYLHNNYVELASSVGIFGLIAFYGVHLFGFWNAWKAKQKKSHPDADIVVLLLILVFINDISNVTYYKQEIFYIVSIAYTLYSDQKKETLRRIHL